MPELYESEDFIYNRIPIRIFNHCFDGVEIFTPAHWHRNIEFNLVTRGRIRRIVDGIQYDQKEGDFFVVNSGELHADHWMEETDHFEGITVQISKKFYGTFGLGEKIFYLTARTITRTVASQAFAILREQDLKMKVITLTAKEKICFCEETICNPDVCPYAKGHFDRVNDAVYELLTSTDEMSREVLEEQARKWNVCPFEMALDVSQWVDAVICDYNYVFDPTAHLKRFFGDGVKGEYLFLIDEAHNLVERGRTMYSSSICKEDFLKIKKLVKYGEPKLVSALESCNKQLLELKRECDGCQILNSVSHVYIKLLSLMTKLEEFIEECKDEVIRKEVLEFYFGIRNFIYIHDRQDENYLIYSELSEEGKFYLHRSVSIRQDVCRNIWGKQIVRYYFRQHFFRSIIIKNCYLQQRKTMQSMRNLHLNQAKDY